MKENAINKAMKTPLLKNEKAVKAALIIGFALIILIFLSSFLSENKNKNNSNSEVAAESSYSEYEKRLEEKLAEAIREVEGVGEFKVLITLDSLSETVYSDKGDAVKTIITPKARGAAIICEGGGDIYVKEKIVELVSKVLGVGANNICVTN